MSEIDDTKEHEIVYPSDDGYPLPQAGTLRPGSLPQDIDYGVPIPGDDEEESIHTQDIANLEEYKPKEDNTPTDDILNSVLEDAKDQSNNEVNEFTSLTIPLSDRFVHSSAINEEINRVGEPTWDKNKNDPNHKDGVLFDATLYYKKQMEFNREALEWMKKQAKDIETLNEIFSRAPIFKEGMTKRASAPKDKVLSGFKARARVIAQMQGMCRIPLMNSGFFITLKALSLSEIAGMVRMCQHNKYHFTREIGGYFYLYADIAVKELILSDFLPKVIQDSSLKDFAQMGTDILKYISMHDYDTILATLAALMFREGIIVRYICTEPLEGMEGEEVTRCEHIEEVKADILKLCVRNDDLITKEMSDFLTNQGKVDPEQVLIYQRNIGKHVVPYRFTVNNGATGIISHWEVKYRVPTAELYLMYGNEYNNMMFYTLGKDAVNAKIDEVFEYLRYNYYKLLLPWIESISEIETIDGQGEDNIIYTVKNDPYDDTSREDIRDILDTISMEDVKLDEGIHEYIKATKITHVVHQYDRCPKCGKAPKNAVDGFIPFDVQSSFFTMCLIRLTAANQSNTTK